MGEPALSLHGRSGIEPPVTTRFAPSPTGLLHLGHAFSAFLAWRRARDAGGRFLLRLEDIDVTRCRPEYAAAILEDLAWLGLDWDGPVRVQTEHLPDYAAVLDALNRRGMLYPCFCTRADIAREIAAATDAPHAPDGGSVYPGTCRALPPAERAARIAAGEPHALRLNLEKALAAAGRALCYEEDGTGSVPCRPERFGDAVLARKDIRASYHLCVTHDDAQGGVTLVTRGEDLRAATDLHVLLQALMDWPTPCYAHHRLLSDARGRRLAKRASAPPIRLLRQQGWSPEAVRDLATVSDYC
ncbi:MAG: tRNA glutamyl-Q(34) synthetase GluQRS [Acetobacteraceae bacterium]|nr:tRNA glutamyl-Q(34) synthetase GluQRS [Acetobacteraceae bacterium]